jgi:hypothetical protein
MRLGTSVVIVRVKRIVHMLMFRLLAAAEAAGAASNSQVLCDLLF